MSSVLGRTEFGKHVSRGVRISPRTTSRLARGNRAHVVFRKLMSGFVALRGRRPPLLEGEAESLMTSGILLPVLRLESPAAVEDGEASDASFKNRVRCVGGSSRAPQLPQARDEVEAAISLGLTEAISNRTHGPIGALTLWPAPPY